MPCEEPTEVESIAPLTVALSVGSVTKKKEELTFVIDGVRELMAPVEIGWLIARPTQGLQGLYVPIRGLFGDPYGDL